jgi:hypothetical protein
MMSFTAGAFYYSTACPQKKSADKAQPYGTPGFSKHVIPQDSYILMEDE